MQTSPKSIPTAGTIEYLGRANTIGRKGAQAVPATERALTIDAREANLIDEALVYLSELRESPTRADPGLPDDIERIERLRGKLRRFLAIAA